MGFFSKIFGNQEEFKYKIILAQVSNPLMDKIDTLNDREVRDFFKTLLDAAERSLRGILFMAPEKFNFKKVLTEEDIDFWLRKVSLAIMAYSYYFFSGGENSPMLQFSYEAYWQRMFDSYNTIFGEKITKDNVNHYAAGLKEDTEKGYSASGNMQKTLELTARDHATIGAELLENIWREKVSPEVKSKIKSYGPSHGDEKLNPISVKIIFLGARVWQSHQQIVQPFLPKLLSNY